MVYTKLTFCLLLFLDTTATGTNNNFKKCTKLMLKIKILHLKLKTFCQSIRC